MNSMNKNDLKKLSKSQLIKMLLKQEKKKPEIIIVDDTKPVPTPRKSVRQMVNDYENNIILPPPEFRDRPVPTPRKSVKQMVNDYENNVILPPPEFRDRPVPLPRTKKPVPLPRTKIEQTDKALNGFTESYKINIKNKKDQLVQLQNTRKAIEYHIMNVLKSMKGLKFVETLNVTFAKMSDGETVYKSAYFNSQVQTIINNTEIAKSLQLSKQNILNQIAIRTSEGSGWTIESVDNHYLNIVKYKPTNGSSYIKLPQELKKQCKGIDQHKK